MKKIKNFVKNSYNRMCIFYLIAIILWVKSYFIQRFMYDLPITTIKQEIILLISPLSSSLLFLAIAGLFSFKKTRALISMNLFFTLVLYANVLYYRFYDDFVTIPVLFQTSNMGDLGGSTIGLMSWTDLLIFIDVIILFVLYFTKKLPERKPYKFELAMIMIAVIGVFTFNLLLAETERTQLLTRTFDREILVKNLGTHNYLIYDIVLQTKSKAQKMMSDPEDFEKVSEYTDEKYLEPNSKYFGLAKDMNVVYVALESLQSFVLDRELHGEEITPYLNKLKNESFYFENFYHQTSQGKTSDSEYIMDNGLYGSSRGAVFFTHSTNNYEALPEILNENNYSTNVFHANGKSFWNRDIIYPNFKLQNFYDVESFEVNDENSVGWGLKDKEFLIQSADIMKGIEQPFYSKLLTLTNHYPFELGEEDATLDKYDSNSKTLNAYFQTVRYLDESLEVFMNKMKEEGLYENTMFVFYGDHYGISELHNRSMARYLEKEKILPLDTLELQKVPFIIHIPGVDPEKIETIAGQIDARPTVLHLLGINTKYTVEFGQDIFSKDPNEAKVVLRDGSVVSKDYSYFDGTCYSNFIEEEIENINCKEIKEYGEKELEINDILINGDLMKYLEKDRFDIKEIKDELIINKEEESEEDK